MIKCIMSKEANELYRSVAKKLTEKLLDNIVKTIERGKSPDLYWKLEKSIFETLKWAHKQGDLEAKEKYLEILKDFEDQDGTPSN